MKKTMISAAAISLVVLVASWVTYTLTDIPEAEEKILWSMPTFRKKHNIISFACFKKHIGLYPGPEAVEKFREQLMDFKTAKGAIHLPYDKPLPVELIKAISKWCYETDNQ